MSMSHLAILVIRHVQIPLSFADKSLFRIEKTSLLHIPQLIYTYARESCKTLLTRHNIQQLRLIIEFSSPYSVVYKYGSPVAILKHADLQQAHLV